LYIKNISFIKIKALQQKAKGQRIAWLLLMDEFRNWLIENPIKLELVLNIKKTIN